MVVEKALPNDNQACQSCWRLMPVGLSRNGVLQNSSHKSFTGVLIKIVSGLLEIFSHFLLGGHHHSIKHDLARSCFQFWPKMGHEGE